MNKILLVQNPNTEDTSCVLIGESLDTMSMILSKPDMNRRLGWINVLHDEIIDTQFTVINPIYKDISKIEQKYHKIWIEDKKNYNLECYMFDALRELKNELDINFVISNTIDDMLNEIDCIETPYSTFIDITKNCINGHMSPTFESVRLENDIDLLVFKFNATDYIGWETVGYCIYDLTNKSMECYISPTRFFLALDKKRYGYCGHVYAYNCMSTRDVFDEKAITAIRHSIETRICEFDDKCNYDNRIDDLFDIKTSV